MWVRQCECGRLDLRERWESADAADDNGVYFADWHCQECGSSELELVEVDNAERIESAETN